MSLSGIEPLPGFDPRLGKELWRLEDTRSRTLAAVEGLSDADVDETAEGLDNTIGSTLYHIAAIEADWVYADILVEDYPSWLADVFPFDVREEDGRLTPVLGFTLAEHLARLVAVREHLLADVTRLDARRLATPNEVEPQSSTPEWAFHHLRQHEAEHRGQIQSIRTALERAIAG